MVLLENVMGILSPPNIKHWRRIITMFKKADYTVSAAKFDARNFNIPQSRKRVFVFGIKSGTSFNPKLVVQTQVDCTIKELLGDLPRIESNENPSHYLCEPCGYISQYLRAPNDILTCHITSAPSDRIRDIYRYVAEVFRKTKQKIKTKDIPNMRRVSKGNYEYQYLPIDPDKNYCGTITGFNHGTSNHIHYDPSQAREVSVREAARLQTFPDSYYFEGGLRSVYQQIGNAVPPMMAQRIADAILRQL
jgi:DNA (cytosine-5)-methyltransferase 1